MTLAVTVHYVLQCNACGAHECIVDNAVLACSKRAREAGWSAMAENVHHCPSCTQKKPRGGRGASE